MSKFYECLQLFCEADVIFEWPHIFRVGTVEKWNFDPGPENYRFAPMTHSRVPNFGPFLGIKFGYFNVCFSPIIQGVKDQNALGYFGLDY